MAGGVGEFMKKRSVVILCRVKLGNSGHIDKIEGRGIKSTVAVNTSKLRAFGHLCNDAFAVFHFFVLLQGHFRDFKIDIFSRKLIWATSSK